MCDDALSGCCVKLLTMGLLGKIVYRVIIYY